MFYCANLQPLMLISLITGSLEQIQLKTYNADFDFCVNKYKTLSVPVRLWAPGEHFLFFSPTVIHVRAHYICVETDDRTPTLAEPLVPRQCSVNRGGHVAMLPC